MKPKLAQTLVPIHDVLARRWSCRAFDRDRPVSREQIVALLEAARWSPSCFGDQPWRFLVWDRNTDEAAWQKAFDCLVEWNRNWVKNAPVLILTTANTVFSKNGKPNHYGEYDTGAAALNLCQQAVSMGLMAHQMGGYDADQARKAFNIPEQFTCMAMIAVGYQAAPDVLDGELKELELAARARSPLEEHFFEGGWGIPFHTSFSS
jgi:nitroreductase